MQAPVTRSLLAAGLVALGPFTSADLSLNFDDAQLAQDGRARITGVTVYSRPESGVDGISVAYSGSGSPLRGRSADATAASLTLDQKSNEYISQAYLVASGRQLEALVFVTNRGRAAGGSSTTHLRHFAAAVPAFPCAPGQQYRLAYIKGRADGGALEQIVLLWAPLNGGAARAGQRQLMEELAFEPLPWAQQQSPSRGASATAKALLHSAAPYRQSNGTGRAQNGRTPNSVANGISKQKRASLPTNSDDGFRPLKRYALPDGRIRALPTATTSTTCILRPPGYTQTGPFNSDGSMQPITSYFNHWLQLGQMVPPAQQPLTKAPAITSISMSADTPERITFISVTFAGGHTIVHGKAAAGGPQARLDLAEDESIVQAMVSSALSEGQLPWWWSGEALRWLSAQLRRLCLFRWWPAQPSGISPSPPPTRGRWRPAGRPCAARPSWQAPAAAATPTGWGIWRAGPARTRWAAVPSAAAFWRLLDGCARPDGCLQCPRFGTPHPHDTLQVLGFTLHWEVLSGSPAMLVQGPAPLAPTDPVGSGWQCVPGIDVLWRVSSRWH
jgi:hypothetical protein